MNEPAPKTRPKNPELRERDERLDALKAALGKMAHDFNNFLVPLLGYVALLQEEVPAGSTAAGYASTLETATRKSEKYLDTILMAMRPYRRFSPKPFNFAATLRQSAHAWQSALPSDSQIALTVSAPEEAHLVGDEAQWKLVIEHLLSNSRHALATGGQLEITLASDQIAFDHSAELNIASGPAYRLVVRDTGVGMNPETLRRCCEPFFSTKGSPAYPGLGLTLAHSITQLHGGQLVIESAEDQGTTVTMWMPPENGAGLGARPSSSARQKDKLEGKILLVEDDPLVREVIKTSLQKTRRDVLVGSDGAEGLKLFNRHAGQVRLVITDVTMPKMNGVELFQAVREQNPEVKVIFVSGADDGPLATLESAKLRQALVLRKPFTLKAFSQVVESCLG
ncbi:MAG TPA: response regulator [Methylomirabilota bacterium]|nr:response regulator [Methylomirabilota bacterium]